MSDTATFMDLPSSGGEELRLSLSEHQGRHFSNLRLWFDAGDGEMRPARQGVTVPLHAIPQLREALTDMEAHARAAGLLAAPRGAKSFTVVSST